jgi:PAS domain S-box-containing protein
LADARLAQAIEGLHDSFILWDADHRLMVANSCAQQLNGNQPSLVRVGVTFEEYIRGVAFSGEAPEIIGHEEEWLARRRKNWQLGNSFLLKRGEKWWLARDHHMADGGFATIATDVTSGKMATEALRERETRLLLALGAAEMGTWDWDTSRRSRSLRRYAVGSAWGSEGRGSTGLSDLESYPSRRPLQPFKPIVFQARDLTGHYEHEFRIVRPDGSTRWLASRGCTLGEIGQSTRIIGVSFDVTERKEAEHALRASEALQKQQAKILQSIIASMGDGVYVADAERKLLLVNPAGASLLGYSPADLIGRIYPVVTGKHYHTDGDRFLPDAERPLAKALRGEPTDDFEFMLKKENVETIFAATARPIRDDDGAIKGAVAVLRDVTEQRRTQRALAQAQKMEAVGQLTGGIAHDFNNLLLVISANSEMLMDALAGSSPDLREMAELSRRAAARGAALTQRLLAFSRQQALEPEALDIDRLVLTMADMLRRAIGEDMSCEFDLGASPQLFCADAAQLETALLNLALNARDAMPQGGRLTIRTRCEVLHRLPNGAPEDQAGGEYACIAVHDTGHGMSSETLARAFEPFFTTKEIGKGSGLGLSMVYGFARQVGGFVNIESAPGSGTTVRLYLRSTASAKAAEQRQGLSPSVSGGATGRILVVEDDPDVRLMVRNMLHGLGYSVATADNAILALTAMSEGELPDLVLSDLVMPGGMSGLECGKVVEARWPAVRMLYMSGYSDEVIRKHGNLTDASRILRKPYSKAELSAAIVASLRE